MKKKTPYNQIAAIRGALRRTFARSPIVREVMMKVRREVPWTKKDGTKAARNRVQYLCAACKKYVGSTHVSVDHVVPVVPESGFTDWNTFISRLFCDASNLQTCCNECHQAKTNAERQARQLIKDKEAYALLLKRPMSTLSPKALKLLARLRKKFIK